MRLEQARNNPLGQVLADRAGEAAKTLLHNVPPETRRWILKRGIEKTLLATTYEYPPFFWETIAEYASIGGFVIVQNHTSNADILAVDLLGNRITQHVNRNVPSERRMQGFTEPFALSLPEGGQGEMSTSYLDVLPLVNRMRVETVPTPTLNDILQGRVTYQQFIDFHKSSTKRMREAAVEERKGIILPAEATVQGGRINPETEDIYGMQVFTPGAIRQDLKIVTIDNDYGIVIPVGVSGGYDVLDSETNKITTDAFLALVGSRKAIMTVHVGEPIIYKKSDIRGLNSESLDYDVATIIAQMLKPNERGVYASPEAFAVALELYKIKQAKEKIAIASLKGAGLNQ